MTLKKNKFCLVIAVTLLFCLKTSGQDADHVGIWKFASTERAAVWQKIAGQNQISTEVFGPEHIIPEYLSRFSILVIPEGWRTDGKLKDALYGWVERGGILILLAQRGDIFPENTTLVTLRNDLLDTTFASYSLFTGWNGLFSFREWEKEFALAGFENLPAETAAILSSAEKPVLCYVSHGKGTVILSGIWLDRFNPDEEITRLNRNDLLRRFLLEDILACGKIPETKLQTRREIIRKIAEETLADGKEYLEYMERSERISREWGTETEQAECQAIIKNLKECYAKSVKCFNDADFNAVLKYLAGFDYAIAPVKKRVNRHILNKKIYFAHWGRAKSCHFANLFTPVYSPEQNYYERRGIICASHVRDFPEEHFNKYKPVSKDNVLSIEIERATDKKDVAILKNFRENNPDTFIAAWINIGKTHHEWEGFNAFVNLFLLETYAYPKETARINLYLERLSPIRGVLEKSLFAPWGAQYPASLGVECFPVLEEMMRHTREKAPQMPGWACFAFNERESQQVVDTLFFRYFILPVIHTSDLTRTGNVLSFTVKNIGLLPLRKSVRFEVKTENGKTAAAKIIKELKPAEVLPVKIVIEEAENKKILLCVSTENKEVTILQPQIEID